jgi:nitrogen fixation/metabolism regulation signal transduction histidine kinase
MTTSNFPSATTPPPYKRSVKNYLIDSRFQLKYTGFIVGVALVISGVMGAFLYTTSRTVISESQRVVEESKKVSDVVKMTIKDDAIYSQNPELAASFAQASAESDRQIEEQGRALVRQQKTMIYSLVGGLLMMVVLIGLLGIYFTHKVAGPVYKMKMLLRQVGDGKLVFHGSLRKGDELKDKLRARQQREVDQLDAALRIAGGAAGATQESIAKVEVVRDEMKRALDK